MSQHFTLRKGLAAVFTAGLAFSGVLGCSNDDDETPVQSGEVIEIEGVAGKVTVLFDDDSIPHIQCETANDCYLALGYLHARDRYIQMEVRRSFVRGRLHRLLPTVAAIAAPIDQANRLRFLTRDGTPGEEAALEYANDETTGLLDAYAVGVNAWLDGAKASSIKLFPDEFYYMLISRNHILEWTPEDSIAAVMALVDSLTNSSVEELDNGASLAAYGPDIFHDLIFTRPVSTALSVFDTDAEPKSAATAPSLPDVSAHAGVLTDAAATMRRGGSLLGDHGQVGSNNWVVGPTRSASGNALLSDDPHLSHTNPATWYVVEMEALDGSLHVSGVTFAGLPWVILGQNKDIAWGATTTYFDQTDVYLETLNEDCTAVLYDGAEVPMIPFDNTVSIEKTTVERHDWIVPHHGPVLSMDCDAKTAVSMRWTGQDLSTDVNFLNDLSRATTVEEARQSLLQITTIGQNWVVIDTKGNYGWFPYNRLPIRTAGSSHAALPFPGDGSSKWEGFIPYDELPQLMNNPEGYITTANNDMTGELYGGLRAPAPRFQSAAADGLRQERIHALLSSSSEHTQETMLEAVGDTYMALGDYVIPGLTTAIEGEEDSAPNATELVALLNDWDGTCPTGLSTSDPTSEPSSDEAKRLAAQGCAVFHRLVYDLRVAIFADEIAAAGPARLAALAALTDIFTENPRLQGGVAYFDNVETEDIVETAAQTIEKAATATIAWLEEKLGEDRAGWLWGRIHRLTLTADLFPEFGIETYNNGAYAFEGGLSTVNVANPSQDPSKGFDSTSGASMRFICEGFPEGMKCSMQIPGGQRHYRDSPYYQNFLERWLTNTPTPLIFNQEIENPVEVVHFVAP